MSLENGLISAFSNALHPPFQTDVLRILILTQATAEYFGQQITS